MSADEGFVDGLLEERRGYVVHGKTGRVAEVDAELAKYGVAVSKDGAVDRPAPADEGIETTEADHTLVETAVQKKRPRG